MKFSSNSEDTHDSGDDQWQVQFQMQTQCTKQANSEDCRGIDQLEDSL